MLRTLLLTTLLAALAGCAVGFDRGFLPMSDVGRSCDSDADCDNPQLECVPADSANADFVCMPVDDGAGASG